MVKCTSCSKEHEEIIVFSCPKCQEKIKRCARCRSLSIGYECKCGFKGP